MQTAVAEAARRSARGDASLRESLRVGANARDALDAALPPCGDALVETARAVAARFEQGATLWVLGSGAAASDADHVAVEFSHPVIVGKRALPAVSLTADVLARLSRPGDVALAIAVVLGSAATLLVAGETHAGDARALEIERRIGALLSE